MNKMMNKILAGMLVITLTFANLILLGMYATESLATGAELEKQETLISGKVDFDAYFLNEEGEKTHTKTIDINSENEKLYVSIEVLQGYFKNAKIELVNSNFTMQNVSDNYELIQEMSENTIALNQIESGSKHTIEIPINIIKTDTINLDNFTRQNQIKITGTSIDNSAKTVNIENTIIANLNLHGEANLSLNQEITKFATYNVGTNSGFMLQQTIKSGIENNNLPIEQTDIKSQVPTLKDGTKPSKITVSANSLEATKNDIEGIEFVSNNWSYDQESGIVSITVKNERNEQNEVTWGKDGLDEYVITYIFANAATPTELSVHLNTTLKIKAYNNEVTDVEKTEEKDIILQEKLGDIVTFELQTQEDSLAKGFLYVNSNYETEYKTTWTADLGYVDLVDQIIMEPKIDRFLDAEGNEYLTTVENEKYAYYKSTQISKDNFTKILGLDENAYIDIYNEETSELIATINNSTQTDENGNIVINYEIETNDICMQTSKPVKEGKLEVTHTKAIKAKTNYTVEQIKTFTKLKTDLVGGIITGEEILEKETAKEILLTEPNTKIDVLVNNEKSINLSTVTKNEDVEFKVMLKNTDISSDLFKNPTIELVFPSYIEKMEISNLGLLFDNELQIDRENIETYKKEDGRLAIKIPVIGTQTIYNFNQTQNGTNIVINADITVNQLTPSINSVIEAYVTNENVTSYEQEKESKAYQELQVNFVAPIGMVTVNSISGYNDKQEVVTSYNGNELVGQINTKTAARNAKATLNIINNYEDTCKNVSILGRIPFKGNKSLASSEDLGSTFTTKMISGITAEAGIDSKDVTVYYTQNENATNELNNESNGWMTDVTSLENIKSYLIVLNNYEMTKGQSLVFSYNIEIPANLQHNESAFGMYAVIFEKENGQDKAISPKVGISTMDGLNLETKMYNNVETNATVQEGQIIKYTVEVINTGKVAANNLKVTSSVPEGTTYVVYVPENTGENGEPEYGPARYIEHPEITTYETTIDTINPGETKQVSYEVKVAELNETTNKKIVTSATITSAEYVEDVYTTNTVENTIEKGYFNISLKANLEEGTDKIGQNQKLFYEIKLNNVNTQTKNNVQIKMNLPQELKYGATYLFDVQENSYLKNDSIAQYNENEGTLIITIDKLEQEEIILAVGVSTNKLEGNETSKQINTLVEATCDETTNVIKSNIVSYKIAKANLVITQTSDIAEGVIAENKELNYIIEITNKGEMTANSVIFSDELPEGLTNILTVFEKSGEKEIVESSSKTVSRLLSIEPQETVIITITVKTDELYGDEKEREIKNIATILSSEIGEIKSNAITHTIDTTVTPPAEDEENENTNTKYRISGMIWVDANEDGVKDDNEEKLANVAVALIDTEKNAVINTSVTDSFGKYAFTDLEKGKYMVAFIYDSTIYTITEYQKESVNESRNSDAIEKSVIIDKEVFDGAVTDDILIENTNAYNIDLGLIVRNKFDLSLTKSISKITVTTTKGTQKYDFENGTNLAKVDIAPKRIEGASVVIEYKFTISNEGNVAGCVNKIVDYLPSELKFNTNMNPDWYQAEDGQIYNASLSNDMINPGETREITLTLTKTMTGENVGIINNRAEIYEAYNELALADINSTPANQAQAENDLGSADVLITVNTGEPVMYITITIIMLVIFAVGAYIINKKILKKTI